MMQDNIAKLRSATREYQRKEEEGITERIVEYIGQRMKANQKEIEKLIQIRKEKITYEQIEEVVKEEIEKESKYKHYQEMKISKENFVAASMLMPIGVIAVEAYDTLEVIRYLLRAIKTRNAIAISDVEYDEQSVKFLVLMIVKEALRKFEIPEELIMIIPYEECYDSYFDQVIQTYNKEGKKFRQNRYQRKKRSNQKYVYIENKELEERALQDNEKEEKEIIDGSMKEVIEKINQTQAEAAVIYTKNPEMAYEFLNCVKSRNVMVNASLENAKEPPVSVYELYEYQNVILPMPKQEKKQEVKVERREENEKVEEKQENSLPMIYQTFPDKVKDFLKRLFHKE